MGFEQHEGDLIMTEYSFHLHKLMDVCTHFKTTSTMTFHLWDVQHLSSMYIHITLFFHNLFCHRSNRLGMTSNTSSLIRVRILGSDAESCDLPNIQFLKYLLLFFIN